MTGRSVRQTCVRKIVTVTYMLLKQYVLRTRTFVKRKGLLCGRHKCTAGKIICLLKGSVLISLEIRVFANQNWVFLESSRVV